MPERWAEEERRRRMYGPAVQGTRETQPDVAARANSVARRLGIDPEVVERNMREIEDRERARSTINTLNRASPYTQQWFANPRNAAATSGEDAERLARMSQNQWTISPIQQPDPTFSSYASGLWNRLTGGFEQMEAGSKMALKDAMDSIFGPPSWNRYRGRQRTDFTIENARRQYERAEARMRINDPLFESSTAEGVYSGVSSFTQQVPALAASVLTRSPAPMLGSAGLQSGTQAYGKYRSRGGTPGEAALGGLGEGGVEVLTELIPAGRFVGAFVPGKSFAREMGISILSDIPGEQIATLAQDALDTAIANPDATWSQYWSERPEAAYQTLIATLTQGAITAGTASAGRYYVRRAETRLSTALLDDIMNDAAETQLRQTDPEAFRQFIEGFAQGTPIENVYIPGEAIRELMQDGYRDDPFWRDFADQIDEAVALEGDVVLPLDAVATNLAGTPEWNILREEARFSAGGMSEAELRSLEESYSRDQEQLAGRLREEADAAVAAAEPVAQVYADVRQQLQNAGFRPDVADRYAALWAANRETWGERLGMTALEYHQQNPVNFRRVLPEKLARAIPADGLDVVVNAMRGGKDAKVKRGKSLLEWIAARGGIEDRGGDIASMGGDKWHREKPFRRKLLKAFDEAQGSFAGSSGGRQNSIESLFNDAISEGYFPDLLHTQALNIEGGIDTATYDDKLDVGTFLDAISAELRGDPVYADEGGDPVYADEGGDADSATNLLREAADELRQLLDQRGVDPDTATKKEIEAAIDASREEEGGRSFDQEDLPDTIDIDGVQRPTKNSNGEQIAANEEGVRNFWAWFGDSKVVDDKGRPLVVYHGTNQPFETFARERLGAATGAGHGASDAFFFTVSEAEARDYALHAGSRVIANIEEHERAVEEARKETERLERAAHRNGDWGAYEEAMARWEDLEISAMREAPETGQRIIPAYLRAVDLAEKDFGGGNSLNSGHITSITEFGDFVTQSAQAGADGLVARNINDSPKGGYISDHYAVFDPLSIKSTTNVGTFDANDPRILYQRRSAFFSQLERAAESIKTNRAPAQQWIATLKKSPGVKTEELEWSGVIDWLEMQTEPVEKDAVLQVIRDGGIRVEETVLSRDALPSATERYGEFYRVDRDEETGEWTVYDNDFLTEYGRFDSEQEAIEEAAYLQQEDSNEIDKAEAPTKFQEWSTDPSSESYRELLITLPLGQANNPARAPETHWDQKGVVAHTRFMDKTGPNGESILFVEEVQSDWHQKGRDQGYAAPSELNAARARYNEARDAWQAAYGEAVSMGVPDDSTSPMQDLRNLNTPEADALADRMEPLGLRVQEAQIAKSNAERGGIPDAPFRSSWPALVMKRVIAWAAENGYDQVAWTTGEQQAERYSLSQAVGGIRAQRQDDGTYVVETDNRQAMETIIDNGMASRDDNSFVTGVMTTDQLKEAFGGNIAEQLIAGADASFEAWAEGDRLGDEVLLDRLEGRDDEADAKAERLVELNDTLPTERGFRLEGEENLRVGGEGMKAFYDRNLGNITNKIIKKYGAKVEPKVVPDFAENESRQRARDELNGVKAVVEKRFTTGGRNSLEAMIERETDPERKADMQEHLDAWDAASSAWQEAGKEELPATNLGFDITPELRDAAQEGFALFQQGDAAPRGRVSGGLISGTDGPAVIELFEGSDLSTIIHETGHVWLEELKANAFREGAPGDITDDWQTVEEWFAANGAPVEEDGTIPTEAHELWARGFERYAMEGKAPSNALKRAFDAFRGWLLTIYKHVDNLRAPITPEIRRVFDRMLATQEAIEEAADAQQVQARFENAEQAGMTQAEFEAYRRTADEARSEAFDALLYRTMATIRAERTKAWNEEKRRVQDDVRERVDARPEVRALHLLRTGRFLGEPDRDPVKVKLDRGWIVDRFGEDSVSMLPKGVPPIYKEGGDNPDQVANMAGFKSGDEMVRALMGVQQATETMREAGDKRSYRAALIEEETRRIMEERHGTPLDDGSIEEEALAAIHNDREGELIASENRQLGKRAGQRPTAYSLARQWAARKIAEGRVVDVASRSALQRYARAQAKAAKGFEAALIEGNVEEAFRQSEIRLLNHALIAEAKKAADRVDMIVPRLSNIAKQRTRKSVDQEYWDRAHALLSKFEFRARSQKALDAQEAFAAWAEKQAAQGIDVVVPPRLEDTGVHYSRMSVEELIGLDESVAQLLHLGRNKKTMLDAKERREFEAIVAEGVATIEDLPQREKNNRMRPNWLDEKKAAVASADAALLKMEQVFDWLDNGNSNGVFNRLVFRPIADAQDREQRMVGDYLRQMQEALKALPKDTLQRWEDHVEVPEFLNRETGEPFTLTRQELVSMALNVGNEGNFAKLAGGYGFNPDAIMRVLQRELTASDWLFVQKMWDMIDTLWPEVEALEKRVNGVAPEKVDPRSFSVTVGEGDAAETLNLRGGYYPVVYDTLKSVDAEMQAAKNSDSLFENVYTRATTPKGFTKERTQVERPVLLSLSVLNRHVTEVIHDITHREAIIAADKLLSNRKVMKAVDDALGREVRKQFRPWLQHIANEWAIDRRGLDGWEAVAKKLRTHSTIIGMGYRLTTIMAQLAGYAGVAEAVGTRPLAAGFKAVGRDPVGTYDFVMERSKEVPHRMQTMERDINANIRDLQGKSGTLANVRRFAFHGIGYMDRVVVIPAWIGSYNKALRDGMTEEQAIFYADKVIRSTQGSGAAKDLAAVQRSNEWMRLATMFYSYASAFYNRQRNLGRDAKRAISERDAAALPGLLARSWWLFVVSPIMGALPGAIMSGGGPEDDETWLGWAMWTMFGNFFYGIPIARDAASSIASGFDYSFTPASRMVETMLNAGGDLAAIIDMDEDTDPSKRSTKNAVEAIGYAARLPVGQVSNAAQFIVDWANGDADPDGVGDWLTGLQRGKLEE